MIAIPNMEKPKECKKCQIFLWCYTNDWKGYEHCPLIDIVTCRECKYRHEHEWYNACDKHIGHGFEDDYFCKYGERANNTRTE